MYLCLVIRFVFVALFLSLSLCFNICFDSFSVSIVHSFANRFHLKTLFALTGVRSQRKAIATTTTKTTTETFALMNTNVKHLSTPFYLIKYHTFYLCQVSYVLVFFFKFSHSLFCVFANVGKISSEQQKKFVHQVYNKYTHFKTLLTKKAKLYGLFKVLMRKLKTFAIYCISFYQIFLEKSTTRPIKFFTLHTFYSSSIRTKFGRCSIRPTQLLRANND